MSQIVERNETNKIKFELIIGFSPCTSREAGTVYPNPAANREIYLLVCFCTVQGHYAVVDWKKEVIRDCRLPSRWYSAIDDFTRRSHRRRVEAEPASNLGRDREQR